MLRVEESRESDIVVVLSHFLNNIMAHVFLHGSECFLCCSFGQKYLKVSWSYIIAEIIPCEHRINRQIFLNISGVGSFVTTEKH